MNSKDNKYIYHNDKNDVHEISEYLERELNDMDERDKKRIRNQEKKPVNNAMLTEKKNRNKVRQTKSRPAKRRPVSKTHKKNKREKAKISKLKKSRTFIHYEKNKLKILWSILGVLVIILLVALITTNINKNDASKDKENIEKMSDLAEKNTTNEEISQDENAFIAEPEDSPYIQVCESFLKNTYVEWNDEELSKICDNTQNLSKDNYTYLNRYIEDIENVKCYVGYEMDDGKVLVFVTYNIKFANVSTSAPAIETVVMVKSQDEDGYLIHNFEVGDEVDLYISNLQNDQDYLDLCSNINTQLDIALESDEDLKRVYDILNENAFIAEPEDSPYIQVCESFLKNTYVEWNDEELSKICDNTQNLSKDNYTYLNKYIEDIENVNCYVGYETDDGKVLVFVTYNMKFANISTSAPAMEAVVMVKSQDGEGYLIHNFEVGDEMDLYTSNVQNNKNYLDLCSNINTQLDIALESDEDLKKVYDILNGMGAE